MAVFYIIQYLIVFFKAHKMNFYASNMYAYTLIFTGYAITKKEVFFIKGTIPP